MTLTIKNAASDIPTVYLYGEIGYDVTADEFRRELANIPTKKPIELHIHSPGGSFFEAVAMHSQLRQRTGKIHAVADGLAASAAHLLLMAGDTIEMAQHSTGMMHEAMQERIERGRASDHRKAADLIDTINQEIVNIYAKRWKGTRDELIGAMDAETWFRPDDAVKWGLADSVSGVEAIAAKADDFARFNYMNMPQFLAEAPPIPPGLEAIAGTVDELFAEESAA